MAIQIRRGSYTNFNPAKLLEGEWAAVLDGDPNTEDGQAVYMCFGSGDVKRMYTAEDAEDNIDASLDTIKTQFTAAINDAIGAAETAAQSVNTAITNTETAIANAEAATANVNDAAKWVWIYYSSEYDGTNFHSTFNEAEDAYVGFCITSTEDEPTDKDDFTWCRFRTTSTGDMAKSVYDSNNNGAVDVAEDIAFDENTTNLWYDKLNDEAEEGEEEEEEGEEEEEEEERTVSINEILSFLGTVEHGQITLASNWIEYDGQEPTLRKCGNVVSLTGAVKPTRAVTPGNGAGVQFMTIPEEFAPNQRTLQICQGSGARKWLLDILPSGGVFCARYGTTTATEELPASTWLPFHITWIVD